MQQNFSYLKVETIVSDSGFKSLGKLSHHKQWKTSVYDTYKKVLNPLWGKAKKRM